MRVALRWLAILTVWMPATAAADDEVSRKLASLESEARALGATLVEPGVPAAAASQRQLVDAQVAFALGDYDAAALMLFDLASRPGADQATALYYLGEAMYQQGDKGAAATYFDQVVSPQHAGSRFYQASLLRLIEIEVALAPPPGSGEEALDAARAGDAASREAQAARYLAALDAIPAGSRVSEAPYVRGKYAYARGDYDEALRLLAEVPRGSSHEYQAAYFTATALVAKKELARATDVLTDLVGRKPRTTNDRRVIELGHLALGRLYYERDQPSKSIDSYLQIDRRSDLFPDALYEVAWVYVKGKQYDKALRALELLHLSDPTSQKTPTVKILEGNLRIRKAQLIRQKAIAGTLERDEPGDPSVEYDRAAQVFAETHDLYLPSYQALARMVDSGVDPAQYLAQIAGRSPAIFQATAPIPEAAAAYLREEPSVQRLVAVETDLGRIEADLTTSEATIARLEGVLAASDPSALYPGLQSRRARAAQLQDDLGRLRADLAEQQLRLVSSGALPSLTSARRALVSAAAGPSPEQLHADRAAAARSQYDALEQSAAEVAAAIDSTQAVAVALRTYAVTAEPALALDQQRAIAETLDASAREALAIERELAAMQRELTVGRDLAGVGDDGLAKGRAARRAAIAALDAEHRALAAAVVSSRDRAKSQRLAALAARAAAISESLVQTDRQIDDLVTRGAEQARVALASERAAVSKHQQELREHERMSRDIGRTELGASFRAVKAKFYDIVIRTDVGSVDVDWSQKEDADDDLKRLNLSRQRDLKQLRDEFKGIIEDPPAPAKPAADAGAAPAPAGADTAPASGAAGAGSPGAGASGAGRGRVPDGGASGGGGASGATGSPDKGAAGPRVSPGAAPAAPAAPTVRPDNKPATPAGAAPKAGPR